MSMAQQPAVPPAFPDRSTRLMVFGIFQILLGCLCGLSGLMMVFAALLAPMARAAQGQQMNPRMMIPALVFYLVMATAFICLGIGSIQARRWAWTLTVVTSWMWLICGAAGCVFFALFAGPAMSATVGQQAKLPPEMLVILQVVMGGFLGCIYVLLPALFLVFYQRESVRATCWYRNPQTCWTDRCPMPVLALCLIYVMSLLGMPSAAANGCVVPVFGNILTGAAGAAVILLMTLIFACLAWGTYRLQMAAWWGMLLLGIVGILNMLMFSQTGLMEMYEKMQMPAAQLELIRKSGMIEMMSRAMPWLGLASGVVWVSYLWYVRQYFVRARRAEA